jgi:hypothetical protein
MHAYIFLLFFSKKTKIAFHGKKNPQINYTMKYL